MIYTDNNEIVTQISMINQALLGDGKLTKQIRQQWEQSIKSNPDFLNQLYDALIDLLNCFDGQPSRESVELCKFIHVFSSNDYISFSAQEAEAPFEKHHDALLSQIKRLLAIPDFVITETDNILYKGTLGEVVENLFSLYFYHTSYMDTEYRKTVSDIILPFAKAFPENGNNLIASFIEENPNAISIYSELIDFYLKANLMDTMASDISMDMLSLYAEKSSFANKNAVKIMNKTLAKADSWTDQEVDNFIYQYIFYPLGISVDTREEKLAKIDRRLAKLKSIPGGVQGIKHYKKERKEVEENYAGMQKKAWIEAVKRAAINSNTFKCIALVHKRWPDANKSETIKSLMNDSSMFKDQPKKYDLKQKPAIVFKDFPFKLLVIEELMYRQKILEPKFDVDEFAGEYTKREISVEEEGYDIIPEVKKYFINLNIPSELLHKVTDLYQDSGLGGGAEVYNHMWRFWDPGVGDDVLKVSNRAINDLTHLPNLKRIIGLENSQPGKKLLAAIQERGILLEDES